MLLETSSQSWEIVVCYIATTSLKWPASMFEIYKGTWASCLSYISCSSSCAQDASWITGVASFPVYIRLRLASLVIFVHVTHYHCTGYERIRFPTCTSPHTVYVHTCTINADTLQLWIWCMVLNGMKLMELNNLIKLY